MLPSSDEINSSINDTVIDRYKRVVQQTPLDYHELASELVDSDLAVTTYALKSQQWSPDNLVKPAVWEHILTFYSPTQPKDKTAVLVVNNGSNYPEKAPSDFSQDTLIEIAQKTRTIVVSVSNVPNQELSYASDSKPLAEDHNVARSWRLFMDDPQGCDFLPLHIPMMGAVIKSMDVAQKVLEPHGIDEFIVTGISKRGWAVWLSALGDKRVKAIVSFAAEVLNLPAIVEHTQYSLAGYFPPAFFCYVNQQITQDRHTDTFKQLMQIEDPWAYLATKAKRFEIPKYVVSASGDDFFMPDNLSLVHNKVPAVTNIRVVPNCDHYGIRICTSSSLIPFINRYQQRQAMPVISLVENQQTASNKAVQFSERPELVKIYYANNPYLRDFRKNAHVPCEENASDSITSNRVIYYEQPLTLSTHNTMGFQHDIPLLQPLQKGWTASFIEATFADGSIVTTPVEIEPDSYPQKPPTLGYIQRNYLLPDRGKDKDPENTMAAGTNIIDSMSAFLGRAEGTGIVDRDIVSLLSDSCSLLSRTDTHCSSSSSP